MDGSTITTGAMPTSCIPTMPPIMARAGSAGGRPCGMDMSGRYGEPGVAELAKLTAVRHILAETPPANG
jgi:hypothetical protein